MHQQTKKLVCLTLSQHLLICGTKPTILLRSDCSELLKVIQHLLKQRLGKVSLFTKPKKKVTVKGQTCWGFDFSFIFSDKRPRSVSGC